VSTGVAQQAGRQLSLRPVDLPGRFVGEVTDPPLSDERMFNERGGEYKEGI
jgi:hypothetical protein